MKNAYLSLGVANMKDILGQHLLLLHLFSVANLLMLAMYLTVSFLKHVTAI